MDGEQEVKDGVEDVTSQPQSLKTDKQSPKEPQLTPELEKMVEKLAHDRYTAKLAKDGDKAKTLEERLNALESTNQKLREEKLADTATRYGLTLEQVKEAGIDDPQKVEALANLFGKARSEVPKPPKVDSGQSSGGGGELTAERIRNMTREEIIAHRSELAKMPLGL